MTISSLNRTKYHTMNIATSSYTLYQSNRNPSITINKPPTFSNISFANSQTTTTTATYNSIVNFQRTPVITRFQTTTTHQPQQLPPTSHHQLPPTNHNNYHPPATTNYHPPTTTTTTHQPQQLPPTNHNNYHPPATTNYHPPTTTTTTHQPPPTTTHQPQQLLPTNHNNYHPPTTTTTHKPPQLPLTNHNNHQPPPSGLLDALARGSPLWQLQLRQGPSRQQLRTQRQSPGISLTTSVFLFVFSFVCLFVCFFVCLFVCLFSCRLFYIFFLNVFFVNPNVSLHISLYV